MGIFTKKEAKAPKTQVQFVREALEAGKTLDMMSMLIDYGIGNHTHVISKLRKQYEKEGKGYDYVVTRFRYLRSKVTGKQIRVAYYFIPEFAEKSSK